MSESRVWCVDRLLSGSWLAARHPSVLAHSVWRARSTLVPVRSVGGSVRVRVVLSSWLAGWVRDVTLTVVLDTVKQNR